jgi:uncharacterized protein (TIRG00374 family)
MFAGGLFFWLAARKVDTEEALHVFRSSDWRWISAGIALFGFGMLLRALRWKIILAFERNVFIGKILRGLLCGYAVNIALPGRLGEFFRADYMARLANAPRSTLLGSIFIERLLDLFAVVSIFAAGLLLSGIQSEQINAVIYIGFVVLAVGCVLISTAVFPAVRRSIAPRVKSLIERLFPHRLAARLSQNFGGFANFFGIVTTWRFASAALLTAPIFVFELLSLYCICRAVGLNIWLVPLLVLLGGGALSTLFPTAPGFVGSYQFAFVLILTKFGFSDTSALVAATGAQVYLMGTYALLGILVLLAPFGLRIVQALSRNGVVFATKSAPPRSDGKGVLGSE